MATELAKAYVQIVPSAEGISGSISAAIEPEAAAAGQSAGVSIAGGIGSAIKGAASVIAASTAAVTGAIVKGTSDVAAYGDNIDKMSQKMGLSAQSYQEWDAVMQHSGTSMEAMKASMKTLANAAQTNSKAFEELGISQEQLGSMSQEQLFEATISALQNVENETERTYLAGKTLGRGATELGALLNTSAEDTQAMRDRVRELGGVMSDDAVKAAAQYQDNMQDLKTAISGVGRGMITQLLPSMNDIIAGFTSLIIGEEGATDKLRTGFQSLFSSIHDIAGGIIQTITTMMPDVIAGIGTVLPELITMATSLIVSLAQALVGAMPQLITTVLPALALAGVQIIMALGQALIETGPALVQAGIDLFNMLKDAFNPTEMLTKGQETVSNVLAGITEALPGVLEKGVEIVTNLVNGILQNLPQMITTAGELVNSFIGFILENLPTYWAAGVELILNLVNGIIDNLPQIVASAAKVIAQFVATIVKNLPQILKTGIELIGKLIAGLLQAIPKLVATIPKIINAIKTAFSGFDWKEIGKNILEGVKNGILNATKMVVDAAKDAASKIWDGIKGFFKIESPSRLTMYAGEMIDAGLAKGILDNQGMVDKAVKSLGNNATASLQINPSYGSFTQMDGPDGLYNLLAKYLPIIASGENVNVTIEADAGRMFKVMQRESRRNTQIAGPNTVLASF